MTITITGFERSPDGGKGLARDRRVRWALEEVDQPYEVQRPTGGDFLLRSPHRRAIDMKTSPAVVVDKLGPLLANDDRLAAAEATIRRIIDDLRRHPSGDARSFGRRQSSFDGGCRRWRDRRPSPLPSL
jgi:hypothetical protein